MWGYRKAHEAHVRTTGIRASDLPKQLTIIRGTVPEKNSFGKCYRGEDASSGLLRHLATMSAVSKAGEVGGR